MSPIPKAGLYYPSKFGLIMIKALEDVMVLEGIAHGLPGGLRPEPHHRRIEHVLLDPGMRLQLLADVTVQAAAGFGVAPRVVERSEQLANGLMIPLQQRCRVHGRPPGTSRLAVTSLTQSRPGSYNCQ